jgi:hypothetical protein
MAQWHDTAKVASCGITLSSKTFSPAGESWLGEYCKYRLPLGLFKIVFPSTHQCMAVKESNRGQPSTWSTLQTVSAYHGRRCDVGGNIKVVSHRLILLLQYDASDSCDHTLAGYEQMLGLSVPPTKGTGLLLTTLPICCFSFMYALGFPCRIAETL